MKSKLYEHEVKGPARIPGRNKKTLSILDDLIRINIDRITGYEKAAHEDSTPDSEWRERFYRMATDSRSYVNNLHAEVIRLGGAPVTQATISGKIYLHWLEARPRFDGPDLISRLGACRAAEMAAQKAYHLALDEPDQLPPDVHDLIETQLWALERAYQSFLIHA
ncbi:MAG TPA: PA2169 family four-helix-bundle protein [Puia sp.]|nr:PA2169 family four-helix-bundle protein [Puia sp.]